MNQVIKETSRNNQKIIQKFEKIIEKLRKFKSYFSKVRNFDWQTPKMKKKNLELDIECTEEKHL